MSRPKELVSVKLIASLLSGDGAAIKPVLKKLENRFGSMDYLSEYMDFRHTDYYRGEMGDKLFRRMVSFERLIKPDSLADIKLFTNSVEDEYLKDGGQRTINIDPGYVSMEKVVLASCKNFAHRIYLKDGVYADLTLIYRNGDFQPVDWTFPDYAGDDMRRLLKEIRERYIHQLQNNISV